MIAQPSAVLFLLMAISVLCYVIWKESRIKQSFPLWIRILAVVVSLLALVLMCFPISYTRTISGRGDGRLIPVFTTGATVEQVDSIRGKRQGYTTDSVLAQTKGLTFITDWQDFVQAHARSHFAIYGYGLSLEQLDILRSYTATYHESPAPPGIVVAHWEQQLEAGSELLVQGVYHNTQNNKVKLYLMNTSNKLDSVEIKANQLDTFSLRFQPKDLGKSLFELLVKVKNDTLQQEKIPVVITEPKARHVLLLAASPSFDYKFLYNWLKDMRYQVISRQRISKDKYLFSNLESSSSDLTTVTASVLAEQDLLIADEEELSRLPVQEQQAILQAVQKGLGLILFGGEGVNRSLPGRLFKWRSPSPSGDRKVRLVSYQHEFPELAVNDLGSLAEEEAQQTQLVEGKMIVAGTKTYGMGKITALTLHQSYAWRLSGQEKTYAKFWSMLTSASLPEKYQQMTYVQSPQFPTVWHWSKLTVLQSSDSSLQLAGKTYPLITDQWIPSVRMFSFWPEREGWSQLAGKKDTLSLYTYSEQNWLAAKQYQLIKANKNFFIGDKVGKKMNNQLTKQVIYFPRWILFVVFFVSVGILWYSARNYN